MFLVNFPGCFLLASKSLDESTLTGPACRRIEEDSVGKKSAVGETAEIAAKRVYSLKLTARPLKRDHFRWWQLKHFRGFHPELWGRTSILTFASYFFQRGWFKTTQPIRWVSWVSSVSVNSTQSFKKPQNCLEKIITAERCLNSPSISSSNHQWFPGQTKQTHHELRPLPCCCLGAFVKPFGGQLGHQKKKHSTVFFSKKTWQPFSLEWWRVFFQSTEKKKKVCGLMSFDLIWFDLIWLWGGVVHVVLSFKCCFPHGLEANFFLSTWELDVLCEAWGATFPSTIFQVEPPWSVEWSCWRMVPWIRQIDFVKILMKFA